MSLDNIKSQGLLKPTYDHIFKAIFGSAESTNILKGFLNDTLNEKIESVELDFNTGFAVEFEDEKSSILDIRARTDNNIEVDIEMQKVKEHNIFSRMLYYWSRIYSKQLNRKNGYKDLHKTVLVLIADFNISEIKEYKNAHTMWKIFEAEYKDKELFNDFELHILEIPKMVKDEKATDKLKKWAEFLYNPESEKMNMYKEKDEPIKEAFIKLKNISMDARMRAIAEAEEKKMLDEIDREIYLREVATAEGLEKGLKEGMEKGMEKGIKQGIEQGKLQILEKMLKTSMSIDEICNITGISRKEIEQIKKKI